MTLGPAIFLASAATVAYAYAAYPAIIWVASRVFGTPPAPPPARDDGPGGGGDAGLPSITVLIAAHDEEAVIGRRIENALATRYPAGKLRVLIASDGSSDGTSAVVRSFAEQGVGLLDYRERRGKSAVLNAAMAGIETDVVLLSDANTDFAPDAAGKLARWFQDPSVGAVCGRLVLIDPATGNNADGLYWKYETFLKTCEARLGALLGSNGAIYAIRTGLYVPIPANTIVDDFVIPLLAKLRSGCRLVYERDAVATEETAADVGGEFRRRVRIGAGGFQAIGLLWRLTSPRWGWLAFALVSHKLLRWACPFALAAMLVSSAVLAGRPAFTAALVAQLAFYATSAAALRVRGRHAALRPLRLATMFTGMNLALAFGFARWLRGVRTGAWERTARPAGPAAASATA